MGDEHRTSEEWKELLYPLTKIINPDGWDRKHFEASWNELITIGEFIKRFNRSTIMQEYEDLHFHIEDRG